MTKLEYFAVYRPVQQKMLETIKLPAMLEQTAEECSELQFACLKLARYLRGENPVHNRSLPNMTESLIEEMCDVLICIETLEQFHPDWEDKVDAIYTQKMQRMKARLEENERAKEQEKETSNVT